MLKRNFKEYEFLKQELNTIRNTITNYIGYIVALCGLSVLGSSIIEQSISCTNEEQENIVMTYTCISLLATATIATFLFEILWYKFITHNRVAGYLNLLSQEIRHYKLTADISKDTKGYVKDQSNLKKYKGRADLISYEFILSRFFETGYINNIKKITDATKKMTFIFDLRNLKDYPFTRFINLDSIFFKDVIFEIFKYKSPTAIGVLYKIFYNLINLYSEKKIRNINSKIDVKYQSVGWQYPRKLLQIGFIIVILLILSCLIIKFSGVFDIVLLAYLKLSFLLIIVSLLVRYIVNTIKLLIDINNELIRNKFSNYKSDIYLFLTITISFFILKFTTNVDQIYDMDYLYILWSYLLIVFWLITYIKKYSDLSTGKYSIQYFCWQFFIFRVQLLNSKGIIPFYYSRGFYRFLKNERFLQKFSNNMQENSENDTLKCDINDNNKLLIFEKLKTYRAFNRKERKYFEDNIKNTFNRP